MKRIIPFLIVVFSFFGSANFAKSGLERVSMFRGNSELTGIYNSKAVNNLEQVKFIFKTMGAIRSSPNKIPSELVGDYSSNCLLRKYLDDGGKIAAFGDNPLAYKLNPQNGVLEDIDYKLAEKVLGVDFIDPRDSRGYYPSSVTKEGQKWGLHDFWTGSGFIIKKEQATKVLATNEFGMATAWDKNYGGPDGTGWLQFNANSYKGIIGELVYQFRTAIEYGIEW